MSNIQSELGAMVGEFGTLEKTMAELSQLVQTVTTETGAFENQLHDISAAGLKAFETFEGSLGTMLDETETSLTGLRSELPSAEVAMTNEAHTLDTATDKTIGAIATLSTSAIHLRDVVVTHADELAQATGHLGEHVKNLTKALGGRLTEATTSANAQVAHLGELAQTWIALGETYAEHIGTSLHETTDFLDQKLFAPLNDAVTHFGELTKQIEDAVLANPLQALSEKLKNEVIAKAHQLIDEAAKEVEHLIDAAVHALAEAGSSNDAVSKEIHAVFKELESAFDSLKSAFKSVLSIWETVKNI